MSAKLRPDKGTVAENIAKKYFPCTCGETYLSRKLTAPDCPYHAFDWEEAFEEYAASSPKVSGEEYNAYWEQMISLLKECEDALNSSYDATGWPANGNSPQEKAAKKVHYYLKLMLPAQPTHPRVEQGFAWFWVKASERLPGSKWSELFHIKYEILHFNNYVEAKGTARIINGEWVSSSFNSESKVRNIEWLERRPLPALLAAAIDLLKDYEQWEADLISDNAMWWPNAPKDRISGKTYDTMLELQKRRNELLSALPEPPIAGYNAASIPAADTK